MPSGSEEYYCPHCNSILNHQIGFDRDCDGWICQECGQMLYREDIFPGNKRCCDSCGDLLNRQIGFSSTHSTWICKRCRHINNLSDYKNADSANNTENRAKRFARNKSTEAADEIYQGNLFPGVMWHCKRCGALLNKQFGFNDYSSLWECAKCGYSNYIMDGELQENTEPKKAEERKEKPKKGNKKTAANTKKHRNRIHRAKLVRETKSSLVNVPNEAFSNSRSQKTEQKQNPLITCQAFFQNPFQLWESISKQATLYIVPSQRSIAIMNL